MKRTSKILIGIFIIAVILRLISAHHLGVDTDEMIYSIIPLNIISGGNIGTVEQSPLAFYLADIGYQVWGGITAISVRLLAVLFGSLAVFVVYLIGRDMFSKRAGIYSAALFALSGYMLEFNFEMDIAAFFFALLSMYYFMRYIKSNGNKMLFYSMTFLAIAAMIKNIIAIFAPAFVLVWLYVHRKNLNGVIKKQGKTLILGILLALLIISPIFAYNYLTFKEKGTTDYYFSNILGIGETVHHGLQNKAWSLSRFVSIIKDRVSDLVRLDLVLLVFGLVGMVMGLKKRFVSSSLLILSALFLVLYLGGQTGSQNHYLWLPLILSIFAGYGLLVVGKRLNSPKIFKFMIAGIFVFVALSTVLTADKVIDMRQDSISLTLRDYVHEEIPEDAIVVIDPRIYRGIHAWVFNDRHYIEGTQFAELQQLPLPGPQTAASLYYIECGEGSYCGWKPEDFDRITPAGEQISAAFTQSTKLVKEIKSEHNYNIYEGTIQVPQGAYEVIDRNHIFWFYPIGWKYPELAVDYYKVSGVKGLIHAFGWAILWLDVLIVFGSIWLVWKEVEKRKSREPQ